MIKLAAWRETHAFEGVDESHALFWESISLRNEYRCPSGEVNLARQDGVTMDGEGVFNSVAHAKGQWAYHIEWAPKYRFKMFLKSGMRADMEEILKRVAVESGITLLELAVMSDHVHVVVEVPPRMSLAQATQLLKGKSSYLFFRKRPNARFRYPKGHLWSVGKFYRTTGDVELDSMRSYVRKQHDAFQTSLLSYAKGTPAL